MWENHPAHKRQYPPLHRSSLNWDLEVLFAGVALHLQNNFLCSLSFLVENWFGLTSETRLFAIVSSLSLCPKTFFTLLVLGNLVRGMFLAFSTESITLFWNANHAYCKPKKKPM